MKVQDLISKSVAPDNMVLRHRVVNRLLKLGFKIDDEMTKATAPVIKEIIAKVVNPDAQAAIKTASIITALPVQIDSRCPICKVPMMEGMLHNGVKTLYCCKCKVAAKPDGRE